MVAAIRTPDRGPKGVSGAGRAAVALVSDFLLRIGEALGLWVLLPISLLLFGAELACAHYKPAQLLALRRFSRAAVLGIVSIAVLLPGAVVATGFVSDRFLSPSYQQASQTMQVMEKQAQELEDKDAGWFKRLADGASEIVGGWKVSFADLFESVVTLIAIFALETVLLPLAFLMAVPSPRRASGPQETWLSRLNGCRAASPWSARSAGT